MRAAHTQVVARSLLRALRPVPGTQAQCEKRSRKNGPLTALAVADAECTLPAALTPLVETAIVNRWGRRARAKSLAANSGTEAAAALAYLSDPIEKEEA